MLRRVVIAGLLAAVQSAAPITPGKWEVDNAMQSAVIDGRPDRTARVISAPTKICVLPEDAAEGPGLAFSNDDEGRCEVVERSLDGGTFAYTLACRGSVLPDRLTTKVAGSYTADAYTADTVTIQQHGRSRIEMRSKVSARRIGECD